MSFSSGKRAFEIAGQLLVFYSVAVFYMESELTAPGADRAEAGFWMWNERVLVGLFCIEYVIRWAQAKDRLRYPFTLMAMIDFVALAPALIGLGLNLRSLKLLRILPLLWIFKLYRYNQALQHVMRGFLKVKDELAVVGFMTLIVLVASSMAMHEFERQAQPDKFARLSDALWWSFVTLTTVGYGDCYPVTGAGRLIAIITMLLGIGILGTFISLVGSSILSTMRDNEQNDEHHPAALPMTDDPSISSWTTRRAG